jgi:hypothetical protein
MIVTVRGRKRSLRRAVVPVVVRAVDIAVPPGAVGRDGTERPSELVAALSSVPVDHTLAAIVGSSPRRD